MAREAERIDLLSGSSGGVVWIDWDRLLVAVVARSREKTFLEIEDVLC